MKVSRLLFVILASVALTSETRADGHSPSAFETTISQYRQLHVGPGSFAMPGLRFEQGHLKLVLNAGNAATVFAGTEAVGIFVAGTGTLEYTSTSGSELAVMAHNVKKATGMRPESRSGTVTVREEFSTALIWMVGRPAVDLAGPAAPSLAGEFAGHRERFLRDASAPASHDFVVRSLNGSAGPLVRAELGGETDLVYLYDTVDAQLETIYCLRKTESPDRDLKRFLWPVVLSEQPIGRDPRQPLASSLDLIDVQLGVTASAGEAAKIMVEETLVPRLRATSAIRLRLYSNDYQFKRFGAVEPRSYNLHRVVDGSGTAVPFEHLNDDLIIGLPAPAPPDQPLKLRFEIDGDILIRPNNDNYWVLGFGPWFPQPDLVGQNYTMRTTVRVKKPYVPFASGRTVARRDEADENVLETTLDKPDRFAIVMAGSYEFHEETRDGLTIRVATYAGRNDIAIRQLTDLAFGIIKFYEPFLGPFPCAEFTIIEMNSYGWGVAPPGAMFITKEAFDARMDGLAWLYTNGINERFAHEIAHQYWGHVVSWPNDEEQWLSEAFAEYSAALFVRHAMGKVEYNALLATWKTSARQAGDISTIATANRISSPLDPEDALRMRDFLIYHKGAWLLSRLHAELGDQTFLTFLKSYQKSFRGKNGTTRDIAGLLQFMTHKDYMPFLMANYWGTGMPE